MEFRLNREDFINEFRKALAGKVLPTEISEHVDYYNQYIDMQMKKGISEQEVLNSLGAPRLLAKTIISVGTGRTKTQYDEYHEENDTTQSRKPNNHQAFRRPYAMTSIPRWLIAVISILFIVLIIVIAIAAIYFLLPFLLIVLLVSLIIKLIRRT